MDSRPGAATTGLTLSAAVSDCIEVALNFWWIMIFSENRFSPPGPSAGAGFFRIML